MTREIEATIWCPRCKEDKYTLYRVPTGQEGVFTHQGEPKDAVVKRCVCGALLERRT